MSSSDNTCLEINNFCDKFQNLDWISTSFREHSSRIRVDFDSLGEKSDSFLPLTLEFKFKSTIQ